MKIYWVIDVLVKEGVKFVCTVFEIAHLFNVYAIVLNFYMIDLYVGSFYEILFCNRCLVKGDVKFVCTVCEIEYLFNV